MLRRLMNGYSAAAASLFLSAAIAAPCLAQVADQGGFVEVTWMRIKQDKVGDFGRLAARIADANRRGKGDIFMCYMDLYGRDNYVTFGSPRISLDEIEPGMNKFMGAVKEMMDYTPERFFSETSATVDVSGTELRRRRMDLSWGVKDIGEWNDLLAKAAYMGVVTIRVKPGHILDAEKQMGMIRDAAMKKEGVRAAGVSEVLMGGSPGTFYVTVPMETISDIAKMGSARGLLGDEGYRTYSQMSAENYASVEYSLRRAVPMWSNPPQAFVDSNPKLWKVKPMAMTAPKTKPAATENKPGTTGAQ